MISENYISIALQDPGDFINPVIRRDSEKVNLELVRRIESEYSDEYGNPTGKFAFFNRRIKDEKDFKASPIIKEFGIRLVGNGRGYLVGGYIHSEFFFRKKDEEDLQDNFPLYNEDLTDLKFSTRLIETPESWARSKSRYEREKYNEGRLQLRVCINTDYEGNITNKEEIIKREIKYFLKRKIDDKHYIKSVFMLITSKYHDSL